MVKIRQAIRRGADQRGYVLVMVALVLVILVGFVALAVDSGFLVDSRTAGQGVADSAALGGAFTFVTSPTAPQPLTATTHATAIATDQAILGDGVVAGDVSVTVDVPNQRVTVDLTYPEETYFARVLGINSADIGVQAVAEAGLTAVGSGCTRPFIVPNTILSTNTACAACGVGPGGVVPPEVIFAGDPPAVTPFAASKLGIGFEFDLTPQGSSDTLAPSIYNFIRLGTSGRGGGAAVLEETIATCGQDPERIVRCRESYFPEPGGTVGGLDPGIERLIGTPSWPTADDLYVAPGEYLVDGVTLSDTSKAVFTVPVWDTCALTGVICPGDDYPPGGSTAVEVIGFIQIFAKGYEGGPPAGRTVRAILIDAYPCGPLDPGEDIDAPLALPVRLIRTP